MRNLKTINLEIIENILNELKKENNKNININLLQSNLMDTRSLIFDQKVIDTMEKILKIKDIFYLDAQIISTEKTKPCIAYSYFA